MPSPPPTLDGPQDSRRWLLCERCGLLYAVPIATPVAEHARTICDTCSELETRPPGRSALRDAGQHGGRDSISVDGGWLIDLPNHGPTGPLSLRELKQLILDDRLSGDTLVWSVGLLDWPALKNLPVFADVLAENARVQAAFESGPTSPIAAVDEAAPAPAGALPEAVSRPNLPAPPSPAPIPAVHQGDRPPLPAPAASTPSPPSPPSPLPPLPTLNAPSPGVRPARGSLNAFAPGASTPATSPEAAPGGDGLDAQHTGAPAWSGAAVRRRAGDPPTPARGLSLPALLEAERERDRARQADALEAGHRAPERPQPAPARPATGGVPLARTPLVRVATPAPGDSPVDGDPGANRVERPLRSATTPLPVRSPSGPLPGPMASPAVLTHVEQAENGLIRRRLDVARSHLQRALQLAPAYPAAIRMLGLLYLVEDKPALAQVLWEKAQTLNPDAAENHLCLGVYHWATGAKGRARGHWRRALALDPHLTNTLETGPAGLIVFELFPDALQALRMSVLRG